MNTPRRLAGLLVGFCLGWTAWADDVDPKGGIEINAGLNGAWFDPTTPGQGYVIEVLGESNAVFMAWFTFTSAAGKVGAEGQRWLTGQGTINGTSVLLALTQTSGGRFDDPMAVTNRPAGAATLSFIDCASAVIEHAVDGEAPGTQNLIRVGETTVCEALRAR